MQYILRKQLKSYYKISMLKIVWKIINTNIVLILNLQYKYMEHNIYFLVLLLDNFI